MPLALPQSMTTTKEAAATIRKSLKALGWTSRMVSVRIDSFSMGSAIDIVIKSSSIPIETVRNIASGAEHIDRCETSGETLCGGNRYLHISYSLPVIQEAIEEIAPLLSDEEGEIVSVRGFDVWKTRDGDYVGQRNGGDCALDRIHAHFADVAARVIAERTMGLPVAPVPTTAGPSAASGYGIAPDYGFGAGPV